MFKRNQELDQKAINAIRILSADAVQNANSGHPGMPLGSAPMAYTLYSRFLKHNPKNPDWFDRDRFVLSAGHASMLQYSLLYLFGYGLTKDDLKDFRKLGSITPGHPEHGLTKGVETTTGPLGQGISTAVGLALAEAHLAARFNKGDAKIVDHYTYALVGDGCLQEGVASEASSFAGTMGLGKLIVLYDDNEITIEGDTDLTFAEDVKARYEAYGWQTIDVADGNDTEAIAEAIKEAKKDTDRPTLIDIHTTIAYGSPLAGSEKTHGSPLGEENIKALRKNLNWELEESFATPDDLNKYMAEQSADLAKNEDAWKEIKTTYAKKYPEDYKLFEALISGKTPDLVNDEAFWEFEGKIATRKTSETCINRISERFANWIGGSADLAGSNLTVQKQESWIQKGDYAGRNIHFGIREFAMACICNGLALHGLRPYCATFLIFSDYLKPALRLSALMKLPVVYVLTHDSIGVGEDGATHEPVEQLDTLRAVPDLYTFRPADGHETAAAYAFALSQNKPVAIALSRQGLPTYKETGKAALKGGYVISCNAKDGKPDLIIIASGSELEIALNAADTLRGEGKTVRVVSMPCVELFLEQEKAYRESVLPSSVDARIAVEAGVDQPWYRFVGRKGAVISMNEFGASGKGPDLFKHFGITAEAVVKAAKEII